MGMREPFSIRLQISCGRVNIYICKKTTLLGGFLNVGIFLFSQDVTIQVSSALSSLTSVFGMGTGGPSTSSTPTVTAFNRYLQIEN